MSNDSHTTYLKNYTPPTHLIDKTDLRFELGTHDTIVTSKLHLRKNPTSKTDGRRLELDGRSEFMSLMEVKLNGVVIPPSEYNVSNKSLSLRGLPAECDLEIKTLLKPQSNTDLEGLYKSGKGVKEKFCTQCEAEGFRNITYYLDRPDVLSEYTTEIIADGKKFPKLLSNGNPIERKTLPDGRISQTWHDPHPKPCYLFALVAGNMDVLDDQFVTQSGRKVKLQLFVDKGDLDKATHAMNSVKKAMAWDEKRFGREYDLDLFQVVAVQDFNSGAMENKGLNIFNASTVLANPQTATDNDFYYIESVVAHEYLHNWSGNRVTCRDWFQLSLKEGLTVFRDQEFSGDEHSEITQRISSMRDLRSRQFPEDSGPMAHPIRPDNYEEIGNFYTTTVYEKGAEVIRMMQTLIGKEAFRKGTDIYFSKHDGQAVTTEDFVKCMEEASGKDLSQFERTWYNQAGTPTLTITDDYDARTQTYTLHVKQSTPPTPGQPTKEPFHIPLRVGLLDDMGKDMPLGLASDVLSVTKAEQDFVFHDIKTKPIPSLLRNFSAPVKMKYDYSREQLAFLMQHDSDGVNRWEAGQQLALSVLQDMVAAKHTHQLMSVDSLLTESLHKILADTSLDKTMVAMMMELPSKSYLTEMTQGPVNPQAIHDAREALKKQLGIDLAPELETVYAANSTSDSYQFTTQDMAQRNLKNVALSYIIASGNTRFAEKQFAAQDNMTDVSAAMYDLIDSDNKTACEKVLKAFYEKWKHDPLVVNQWLDMSATSDKHADIASIKNLMQHEAFDITEPDKVRAVLGTFARANMNFHALDGSGYKFFADELIAYDKINKQTAANLSKIMTRWHMYEEPRASLMKAELQRIADAPSLSRNTKEIVTKSLDFQKRDPAR